MIPNPTSVSIGTADPRPSPSPRRSTILSDHPRIISSISVIAFLLLWEVLLRWVHPSALIPPFSAVVLKGWELCESGELFVHTGASLARIATGFCIGSLIGAPLGLLIGASKVVRAVFDPFVQFFRFIPAIAWLTPAVIWFGIGEQPRIMIIVYATLFIVAINSAVGVSSIAENKIWAGRTLGATPSQVFLHIGIPATLPYVLTGMRLAMGFAFTGVVSAEMIASERGLGYLIFNSRLWMATDSIFVGIFVLGMLGWTCDTLFRQVTRRFTHQR